MCIFAKEIIRLSWNINIHKKNLKSKKLAILLVLVFVLLKRSSEEAWLLTNLRVNYMQWWMRFTKQKHVFELKIAIIGTF